ncbi:putative acetyltransferase [Listeria monocytogenes]|nr:putative acetyltransferase GNAT family [Listeria monocytogenes]GAT38806.1 putative acetyltransferase [Listeria monocytogenes]
MFADARNDKRFADFAVAVFFIKTNSDNPRIAPNNICAALPNFRFTVCK